MTDNLLEKVIVSTEIGAPAGSGLLKPDQANRFIDYVFDATVLGSQVRTERLRADSAELNRIGVGQRLIRGAVEATDTGENQGVVFSKISLTTKKIRLDYELSSETLEDNIEGAALEDHIARLMATQMGNDLEDLAVNGDTSSSDLSLKIFDGWRKLALNGTSDGAAHTVDAGGSNVSLSIYNRALKAIPRKYMQRRGELKFFTGSNLLQDWYYALSQGAAGEDVQNSVIANGNIVPQGPAGATAGYAFGIPLQEVPVFDTAKAGNYSGASGDHGEVWLTQPRNLIWAVKRDVQVFREFKPKKDSIEYTTYLRAGVGIENTESMVIVRNVKVRS